MTTDETVLMKMADAARLLSMNRSRAYALALRGELPGALRIAGSWRVNRRVLQAWADRAAAEGVNAGPNVDSETPDTAP
jgi:hypothetical protein